MYIHIYKYIHKLLSYLSARNLRLFEVEIVVADGAPDIAMLYLQAAAAALLAAGHAQWGDAGASSVTADTNIFVVNTVV